MFASNVAVMNSGKMGYEANSGVKLQYESAAGFVIANIT
jgi:hypothetical protein